MFFDIKGDLCDGQKYGVDMEYVIGLWLLIQILDKKRWERIWRELKK